MCAVKGPEIRFLLIFGKSKELHTISDLPLGESDTGKHMEKKRERMCC